MFLYTLCGNERQNTNLDSINDHYWYKCISCSWFQLLSLSILPLRCDWVLVNCIFSGTFLISNILPDLCQLLMNPQRSQSWRTMALYCHPTCRGWQGSRSWSWTWEMNGKISVSRAEGHYWGRMRLVGGTDKVRLSILNKKCILNADFHTRYPV